MSEHVTCHPDGTKLYQVTTRSTTPMDDSASKEIRCANQVLEIELTTPLDEGSKNDGSGTGIARAMLVERTYTFMVKKYRFGPPQDLSSIRWQISYTSPTTSFNKVIILQCQAEKPGKRSDIFDLNIERLFKDQGYDMCGCEISVTAYIGDPTSGAVLKQQLHNRFRWFDAKKFVKQIEQRTLEPWRIDQGNSSLCGMAALYYVMALRRSDSYKKLTIELHRTGIYQSSPSYVIRPVKSMYEIKPSNWKFRQMRMWDADWIVLAGTRSGESNLRYDGIESGSLDQAKAINWAGMLARLLKEVAGFASSRDRTTPIFPADGSKGETVQTLSEIDRKFMNGRCDFLMEIEPELLYGTTTRVTTDRHWIVYAGGLVFLTTTECRVSVSFSDSDSLSAVRMNIFTWGRNPDTSDYFELDTTVPVKKRLKIVSPGGISLESFRSGFHGFVEVC
jgi:hypothetical protein